MNSLKIKYFDPFKYFCNEVECKTIESGKIFFADAGHLSIFGGDFLATKGNLELKKLLSK
jgi:hypothetical protein